MNTINYEAQSLMPLPDPEFSIKDGNYLGIWSSNVVSILRTPAEGGGYLRIIVDNGIRGTSHCAVIIKDRQAGIVALSNYVLK